MGSKDLKDNVFGGSAGRMQKALGDKDNFITKQMTVIQAFSERFDQLDQTEKHHHCTHLEPCRSPGDIATKNNNIENKRLGLTVRGTNINKLLLLPVDTFETNDYQIWVYQLVVKWCIEDGSFLFLLLVNAQQKKLVVQMDGCQPEKPNHLFARSQQLQVRFADANSENKKQKAGLSLCPGRKDLKTRDERFEFYRTRRCRTKWGRSALMRISWRKQRKREFIDLSMSEKVGSHSLPNRTTTTDKKYVAENGCWKCSTKKHIQCTFIERELLGFLWFEIILYKQRLIELFGSYVVTIHHRKATGPGYSVSYNYQGECPNAINLHRFPPRLHKASTECANANKCFAEDYQTEHRRKLRNPIPVLVSQYSTLTDGRYPRLTFWYPHNFSLKAGMSAGSSSDQHLRCRWLKPLDCIAEEEGIKQDKKMELMAQQIQVCNAWLREKTF
ncbi:hypothetical protein PROFUN_01499 [Planoprotostelium fungivorum]|uniref:Uncharacterized protein n=1 Tax=Planoprotostelium fungivorum TaxID=1890364 RepID=A0A2P6NTD5_9EUKA|nr:hypothetical protein PROFUN_01499 [Planoprotostelium fungivorum]